MNKDFPVFEAGEKIKLSVTYKSKKVFNDMAFRISILTTDGRVIGQATSAPVIAVKQGENATALTLNVDWLAPGKYGIKLVAYMVNEYGGNMNLDVVDMACFFEKTQSGNNGMVWNHEWWGDISFPEIQIAE